MKRVRIIILFLVCVTLFVFVMNRGQLKKVNTPPTPSTEMKTPVPTDDIPQTTVIAQNLDTPWAIVFLPDNKMLVTERAGRVRLITDHWQLQDAPVAVIDNAIEFGEGGLLGMALHPNFASNAWVYLYYTYRGESNDTRNRVVRMEYRNGKLSKEHTVIDNIPGSSNHNGGRIRFGPDGYLYITTGDAQNPSTAQDKNSLSGKILRVTDEGNPAPGNPFSTTVYSFGHRNPQGLAWDDNGRLWETEHGPSGIWPNCCQDELNAIISGGNYGWPESHGTIVKTNTVAPLYESGNETLAPAGIAVIGGTIYFTGLRGQSLYTLNLSSTGAPSIRRYLSNTYGRLRESIVGPDGMLYVTTSNRDGRGLPATDDDRIIRVNTAKLSK